MKKLLTIAALSLATLTAACGDEVTNERNVIVMPADNATSNEV